MEKYAWRGKIVPGMQEEYKKRHDNIWPEMKEVLADAGIVNYSIWMQGEELFGYYECEKGVEYAAKVQAESSVVKKWDEYMKDIHLSKHRVDFLDLINLRFLDLSVEH